MGGLGGKSANSNKFSYFLLIHLRHDMREREEQEVYERKRFYWVCCNNIESMYDARSSTEGIYVECGI